KLHIGQVLKLPGTGSVVSKNKTPNISKDKNDVSKVYRVRRGDVPLEIAKRHNMPLHRLLQVNHLSKRSKIYPGQKLYVD
ncbi:MAG: lytic transglycosylase, partial [Deltaproteobacteria bacterium]